MSPTRRKFRGTNRVDRYMMVLVHPLRPRTLNSSLSQSTASIRSNISLSTMNSSELIPNISAEVPMLLSPTPPLAFHPRHPMFPNSIPNNLPSSSSSMTPLSTDKLTLATSQKLVCLPPTVHHPMPPPPCPSIAGLNRTTKSHLLFIMLLTITLIKVV